MGKERLSRTLNSNSSYCAVGDCLARMNYGIKPPIVHVHGCSTCQCTAMSLSYQEHTLQATEYTKISMNSRRLLIHGNQGTFDDGPPPRHLLLQSIHSARNLGWRMAMIECKMVSILIATWLYQHTYSDKFLQIHKGTTLTRSECRKSTSSPAVIFSLHL